MRHLTPEKSAAARRRPTWLLLSLYLIAMFAGIAGASEPAATETFTVRKVRELAHKTGVSAAAWSPNGKQIATLSNLFRRITLWDAETGTITREWEIAKAPPGSNSLSFTPDGRHIVAAADMSDEGHKGTTVVFWDLSTGQPALYAMGPTPDGDPRGNAAKMFALSPDGNYLAVQPSSRIGGPIVLYSQKNLSILGTLPGKTDMPLMMSFSPDSHQLAVGTMRGVLDIFDVEEKKLIRTIQIYENRAGGVKSLAFSPDGRLIATGFGGSLGSGVISTDPLQLIDASTGGVVAKSPSVSQRIWSVSWESDGKVLATGEDNGHCYFRIASLGESPFGDIDLGSAVMSIKFAPDGPRFVAAGNKTAVVGEILRH